MTRLHPAARWGALLVAAGASLATSPDDSAPRLEAYVDAPAFHLNADHPAQGFVITVARPPPPCGPRGATAAG